MTLEQVTAPLEEEWDGLAENAVAPPFLHPGWFRAWHDAFGGGALRVVAVRRGGRLEAAAPVLVAGSVVRSPTNWHSPGFGLIARDDSAAAELVARLVGLRARRLDLGHLDRDGQLRITAAADARDSRTTAWVQQRSPYVDTTGAAGAYLAERDQRWLRQLERRRERLGRKGRLDLDVVTSTDRLAELLEEGFALEAAGWKGSAGTAILSSPVTHRFYRAIASWALDRGFLRLAFLRLDGRAIAFDLALEHAGAHYFLKTGYDPGLSSAAPGLILRRDMILRAFELGLSSYELLGGAESYKLAWTTTTRPRYRVMAFDRSIAGSLDFVVQAHGRPAAKAARSWLQDVRATVRPTVAGRTR